MDQIDLFENYSCSMRSYAKKTKNRKKNDNETTLSICLCLFWKLIMVIVGYHLPFQHNELFHSAIYGSSGDQSEKDKPTSQTKRAVPIVEVYHYSITNPMFLLLTVYLL